MVELMYGQISYEGFVPFLPELVAQTTNFAGTEYGDASQKEPKQGPEFPDHISSPHRHFIASLSYLKSPNA